MAQPLDNIIRFRAPSSLVAKLKAAADQYARLPSDVAREAVAMQVERLTRRTAGQGGDVDPPEAA